MTRGVCVVVVFWTVTVWLGPARADGQSLQGAGPDREITQLRGDLYDAREGTQHTVFLVTPEGIILGDPLNTPFAQWLKEQLASRFPGSAVRYVLFTHHHFDRADGGSVFVGAAMVGQDRYNLELMRARDTPPTFLGMQDRNGNKRFDQDEIEGSSSALLLSFDRNRDGAVTPNELYSLAPSVRNTYRARRTITLGGKRVELVHSGTWHSQDMTVLFFPDERTVFAADPPPVTVVPYAFGGTPPRQVYDWLHAVAPLDFETLVTGDGKTLSPMELRALMGYLDELRAEVAGGYERGQTLAEIQAAPLLQDYQGTEQYAGRAQQVADVYRTLRLRRVTLSVLGNANYASREASFCGSYSFCTGGGMVPAGTAAVSLLLGTKIGVVGEFVLSGQSWSTRRRQPLYDEETALRETRASVLFRFTPVRALALLGGPTFTTADVRGTNVVRGKLVPVGGRHAIHEKDSRVGVTAGVELSVPVGGGVTLVAPVRVLYTPSSLPDYWPSRVDVTAGVGISIRLIRRVN